MSRILVAPAVQTDIEPYVSPVSGKVINSRSERRKELKAGGYMEWEPGIKEQVEKKRRANEEAFTKQLDSAVDAVVCEMAVTGKLETANA